MKRIMCIIIMIAVFFCTLSIAEESVAYHTQKILLNDDYTDLVICCGGTLYVRSESGIYKLNGDGEKALLISASELPSDIVLLLSDRNCIYAIQYNNGEATLIQIVKDNGEIINQPVLLLEDVSWKSISNCVLRNGVLYYEASDGDYSDSSIVMVTISDNTRQSLQIENLSGFDVMNDGRIMALTIEEEWMTRNVFLKIISSDKKDIIEWTQIENEEYSSKLLYDEYTDTVYFMGQREVYKVQKGEQPLLTGISFSQDICSSCLLSNGIAIVSGISLNIYSFGEDVSSQRMSLTICGPYAEDEFFISFYKSHPMTDIRTIDAYTAEPEERFISDMLNQNPEIDIYILHDLNLLRMIKSKGYYVDLSVSDVIKEKISRMYEPFKKAFTYDGKVAAFPHPWYVFFTTICYNTDLFHDLNLSVPTTWNEYFDFCIEWKEKYEDEYPEIYVNPFVHDLSFVSLLAQYDDEMTRNGEKADYQSEMIRTVLEKYLKVQQLYMNNESTGRTLFYDYDLQVASDDSGEYYLLPLTFIKESEPIYTPMEEDVYYFVANPYSNHKQDAVDCIAAAEDITRMNDPSIYTDIPDLPLENAYYEEGLRMYQDTLDMLEARKKSNEDDPDTLLEINEEIEKTTEEMKDYEENKRWWFTEEDMVPYREINNHVYFSDFNPIRELHSDDPDFFNQVTEENLPSFLHTLDNRIRMIRIEQDSIN